MARFLKVKEIKQQHIFALEMKSAAQNTNMSTWVGHYSLQTSDHIFAIYTHHPEYHPHS